jgi:hypothetical protein
VIVEVAPAPNAALDRAVLARNGTVAFTQRTVATSWNFDLGADASKRAVPVRPRLHLSAEAKATAVRDVAVAAGEGALPVERTRACRCTDSRSSGRPTPMTRSRAAPSARS